MSSIAANPAAIVYFEPKQDATLSIMGRDGQKTTVKNCEFDNVVSPDVIATDSDMAQMDLERGVQKGLVRFDGRGMVSNLALSANASDDLCFYKQQHELRNPDWRANAHSGLCMNIYADGAIPKGHEVVSIANLDTGAAQIVFLLVQNPRLDHVRHLYALNASGGLRGSRLLDVDLSEDHSDPNPIGAPVGMTVKHCDSTVVVAVSFLYGITLVVMKDSARKVLNLTDLVFYDETRLVGNPVIAFSSEHGLAEIMSSSASGDLMNWSMRCDIFFRETNKRHTVSAIPQVRDVKAIGPSTRKDEFATQHDDSSVNRYRVRSQKDAIDAIDAMSKLSLD